MQLSLSLSLSHNRNEGLLSAVRYTSHEMTSQHCFATLVRWLFVLVLFAVTPSSSFPTTQSRKSKAANKAQEKFSRWKQQNEGPKILWVDGNNVRGIGKFEWNAVELQHKVVKFCYQNEIETAIVVWDHGSAKFATCAKYESKDGVCVNLLTLFSGLTQRADDVLVKESNHLVTTTHDNITKSLDWGSLAFVTNDRDLNYKLRNQVTPNPPSIRLGRRKRGGTGKVYDASAASTSSSSSLKIRNDPLFCDSTGFVELLYDMDVELSPKELKAYEQIENTTTNIRYCSKSQRRGYNPRREQTWERCVQAETLRRHLLENDETKSSSGFVVDFLEELQNDRGYSILGDASNNNNKDVLPFSGPSRLDKHQRRMLDRYNAMVKSGEI